jgi:hypothetical protein
MPTRYNPVGHHQSKLVSRPAANDADDPYSRAELLAMDDSVSRSRNGPSTRIARAAGFSTGRVIRVYPLKLKLDAQRDSTLKSHLGPKRR